jgi:hypothetical protein
MVEIDTIKSHDLILDKSRLLRKLCTHLEKVLCVRFYTLRRAQPREIRPNPSNTSDEGSGTAIGDNFVLKI